MLCESTIISWYNLPVNLIPRLISTSSHKFLYIFPQLFSLYALSNSPPVTSGSSRFKRIFNPSLNVKKYMHSKQDIALNPRHSPSTPPMYDKRSTVLKSCNKNNSETWALCIPIINFHEKIPENSVKNSRMIFFWKWHTYLSKYHYWLSKYSLCFSFEIWFGI